MRRVKNAMQLKLTSSLESRLATAAALLAGACWGVSFLAPRALLDSPPAVIALFRFLFFGLTSIPALILGRNRRPTIDLRTFQLALGLSLAGFSLYYALLALGVKGIGVTFATAIIALLPLTILLSSTSLREWRRLGVPIVLIAAGGALVPIELFGVSSVDLISRTPFERAIGLGSTVSALVLWTIFAIANARFLRRNPEWRALDWAGVLGLASALTASLIFLLIEREDSVREFVSALGNPRFLFWTAFMGIAGAWFSGALWNYASRVLPPATMGMLLVFESVFGLTFGFIYDRRGPTFREGLAAACLVAGAVIGIRLMNRRPVN